MTAYSKSHTLRWYLRKHSIRKDYKDRRNHRLTENGQKEEDRLIKAPWRRIRFSRKAIKKTKMRKSCNTRNNDKVRLKIKQLIKTNEQNSHRMSY